MRVLFHMLGEFGHHLPVFPFAQALRARGHEVVFLAILDMKAEIETRGFGYAPIHEGVFPLGALNELDHLPTADRAWATRVARMRQLEEWMSGATERLIARIDPAVMLVDVITVPMALVAHRLGVPYLRVSTSLSQRLDELPPLTSELAIDTPYFELAASRAEASARRTNRELMALSSYTTARFGYPPEELSFDTVFAPHVTRVPEIVLASPAFDLPRTNSSPTYFTSHVERARPETVPDELVRYVDDARPLVLASLGSQSGRSPYAAEFFAAVLETFRAHPEWRGVVATGERFYGAFDDPPENLLAVKRVPQIWLLSRAKVFVTHAGLGSVREAIALHVPIIAVPQAYDQPGNTTRIVHHGIGLHVRAASVSGSTLSAAIATILADHPGFTSRLEALDAAERRHADDPQVLELVERTAKQPSPRRAPPARSAQSPQAIPLAWCFVDQRGRLPERIELRAGATVRADDGGELAVGVRGFAICRNLGDALERANGSFVARVRTHGPVVERGPYVVAPELSCLWIAEVGAELREYASWCIEVAVERDRAKASDIHATYFEHVRRLHEVVATGDAAAASSARRAFVERAQPLIYRGYSDCLAFERPEDAARFARFHMSNHLALVDVASLAGTAEGADRYVIAHAAARTRGDDHLLERIVATARSLGLPVDDVV